MTKFSSKFIDFFEEALMIDIESDSRSYLKLKREGGWEEIDYEREFYAYSIVLEKEDVQTDWITGDYWEVLEELEKVFNADGGEAVYKYIKDNFSVM